MSVQARLDIINRFIAADFTGKVTMEMLNSKDYVSLKLQPEKEAEILGVRTTDRVSVEQLRKGMPGTEREMPKRDNDKSGTLDEQHKACASAACLENGQRHLEAESLWHRSTLPDSFPPMP